MTQDQAVPFTYGVDAATATLERYDNHIVRRLSALRGQFLDEAAFDAMVAQEDTLLYEVYEVTRPNEPASCRTASPSCTPARSAASIS